MPQTKLLLDTNTYLRLAQSIHPLLGKSFGKEKLTLYIHDKIEKELKRSPRLKTQFYWIEQEEYLTNRKKKLTFSKQEKENIELTYDHIWEFQKDVSFNLNIPLYADMVTAITDLISEFTEIRMSDWNIDYVTDVVP